MKYFIQRLIRLFNKGYNKISLDSREYMFYEMILYKKMLKKKYNISFGDYLEFGVYKGDGTVAFVKALKKFKNEFKNTELFLFDSFTGLPEKVSFKDDLDIWHKGLFDVGGKEKFKAIIKKKGLPLEKIKIIDGFFNESLKSLNLDLKPGIINIDCDYYSSAKTVLNFLNDKMVAGTLIYFDDLNSFFNNPNKGVLSAILEFNKNNTNVGLAECPFFSSKYNNRIYWVWKND